jgi:hypothetical protein
LDNSAVGGDGASFPEVEASFEGRARAWWIKGFAAGPIRETDLASGASGRFDPAIAGFGPVRAAGSHLATSQAVDLAIVYASQLDPGSSRSTPRARCLYSQ